MLEMEGGRVLPTTDDGFLLNTSDWDEQVGEALAATANIALTEAHWEIIHFIRNYYFNFNHLPNARLFVKAVQKTLGEDKGNSRYLSGLFPGSPVKSACLIGGLPKPPGCI